MSLLTHIRKVVFETLLSPKHREFVTDFSEAELYKHVQKCVFAPANPEDYFFSTVVCVTEYPVPDDNEHDFWYDAGQRVRTEDYDVWFEALCAGQMGVVHEIRREKKLDAIVSASSQEYAYTFSAKIQATLERYNIHSPIEQLFYASWECARERLWSQQDSAANRFLWLFQLRPQYVLYREPREKPEHLHDRAYEEWSKHRKHGSVYRVDFAVAKLDTVTYFDNTESFDPIARDSKMFTLQLIAIECDSFQFHVKNLSNRDFEALKRRERFFTALGWQIFSFTGSEITKTPMACVKEVHRHLLRTSGQLDAYLNYNSIYAEIPNL